MKKRKALKEMKEAAREYEAAFRLGKSQLASSMRLSTAALYYAKALLRKETAGR